MNNQINKVLLIGIGGVYNYGCEAIVRGTATILRSINPDVKITYASYNYDDDVRRLSDLNINIIERRHVKKWSTRNILRKLLSYFNIKYSIPFDNIKVFKSYDYALSIGGDMYTLNHNGNFDKSLPDFMSQLKKQGCKYILWGCSVGPFDKNPDAIRYFVKHLSNVDLIVAREPATIKYLDSLGISSNVEFAPDPAFMVKGSIRGKKSGNKSTITFGINLSPLSALYEYGNLERALEVQAGFIERLIKTYNSAIILLPHVISSNSNDNDLEYLTKLYSFLPSSIQRKVHIADDDAGFVGIKKHILNCDIVIAARMHCAINAVATGVPALFLSYSSKAKGMSNFIYGSEEYVIDLKDLAETDRLKSKIDKLLNYNLDINNIQLFNFKKLFDN